jgi:hypothetical protein
MQFVARRLAGEAMAELCREFGIARKTGYKIFQFMRIVMGTPASVRESLNAAFLIAIVGGGNALKECSPAYHISTVSTYHCSERRMREMVTMYFIGFDLLVFVRRAAVL